MTWKHTWSKVVYKRLNKADKMECRNILDQFSLFQFGKEANNIPMQKWQMFETGLVGRFSTITTHLSFSSGVICIPAYFSFYTNINFMRAICLYIITNQHTHWTAARQYGMYQSNKITGPAGILCMTKFFQLIVFV